MHLDIKRTGLDEAIADLLTRMDMWDHVAYCNTETGGVILRDPRFKPRRYKAGLYLDRGEVFPDAIAAALKKPGDGVIVDDPRGAVRRPGPQARQAVEGARVAATAATRSAGDAARRGGADRGAPRNADDWDRVADTAADMIGSGERIRAARWRRSSCWPSRRRRRSLRGPGRTRPQAEPAQGLDVPRLRRRDGPALADPAPCARRRRDWPASPCGATTQPWSRSSTRAGRTRGPGPTSA